MSRRTLRPRLLVGVVLTLLSVVLSVSLASPPPALRSTVTGISPHLQLGATELGRVVRSSDTRVLRLALRPSQPTAAAQAAIVSLVAALLFGAAFLPRRRAVPLHVVALRRRPAGRGPPAA